MKDRRGLIQIPLLIAIVAGVLVLGGVGYLGVKQYQKSQQENIAKEQQAQEQQKALEQAQAEIEKLKQGNELTQAKQKELEQKVNTEKPASNTSISSNELAPYLSAVVNIRCYSDKAVSSGSGTFWKYNGESAVLTNDHVIMSGYSPNCIASWEYDVAKGNIRGDSFLADRTIDLDWNKETDIRVAFIGNDSKSTGGVLATSLNYKLYSLRHCPIKMPIGSPVVVIGYPTSTQSETNTPRTITNGIISGLDQSVQPPQGVLPSVDYYVSNKIDSGNSGGIALSKDNSGLCVLGVPTWLQVGNYDTQGIVQNIHNVLSKQ